MPIIIGSVSAEGIPVQIRKLTVGKVINQVVRFLALWLCSLVVVMGLVKSVFGGRGELGHLASNLGSNHRAEGGAHYQRDGRGKAGALICVMLAHLGRASANILAVT